MKRQASRITARPVRPAYHTDLFETIFLDVLSGGTKRKRWPLMPQIAERGVAASDMVERLQGGFHGKDKDADDARALAKLTKFIG
jgi:hypothetical protein